MAIKLIISLLRMLLKLTFLSIKVPPLLFYVIFLYNLSKTTVNTKVENKIKVKILLKQKHISTSNIF